MSLEQVSQHVVVTMDASSAGWCVQRAGSLSGRLNCFGVSIVSSCWQCCLVSTCWSTRTTMRLSRTSTSKVVYDHVACHNSPAISSSGVKPSASRCMPSTTWGSFIVQPSCSHNSSRYPENGDSIPRRFSSSAVDSGKLS